MEGISSLRASAIRAGNAIPKTNAKEVDVIRASFIVLAILRLGSHSVLTDKDEKMDVGENVKI